MARRAPRWPDGEGRREASVRLGDAGEAMLAVSRLLGTATEAGGPNALAETLVAEARRFFRVSRALLASVAELEGRLDVVAVSPARDAASPSISLSQLGPMAQLLSSAQRALQVRRPGAA